MNTIREDGYYEVVLGGLNISGSTGYYDYEDNYKCFEPDSELMLKVKAGTLYGEIGHPVCDDHADLFGRMSQVSLNGIGFHIKDVWLDKTYGSKNPSLCDENCVAIKGLIIPTGIHGHLLRDKIVNSDTINFGMRSICRVYDEETSPRLIIDKIMTWDLVLEPAINIARN